MGKVSKALSFWYGKIKEYVDIDLNKVRKEELEFLKNYKNEKEFGCLRLHTRKALYEKIIDKLPNQDKEILLEDLELFDLAIEAAELEIEKVTKKIELFEKINC